MADAVLTVEHVQTFGSREMAWFRFAYGTMFISFGVVTLSIFYRARKAFEIRARSAYLVTLLGLALLAYQVLLLDLNVIVLYDISASYFWHHIVLHFLTFTITACYISRVIRLGVIFDASLRRAMPWLVSEKVLVIASISVGLVSLVIPLYYRATITGKDAEREYERVSSHNFWVCIVVLQVVKCIMLPGVWMIDDIFNISRELIVIIALGLFQCVFSRLAEEHMLGSMVEMWINPANIGILASSILFGLSVVDPVRRLTFHPLSGYGNTSKIHEVEAEDDPPETERTDVPRTPALTDDSETGPAAMSISRPCSVAWNYETIARDPEVSEAFREFAHRALCQESVDFLEEVTRYKVGNYALSAPRGGGQQAAFENMTKRFIVDGAPDEINISFKEKKAILGHTKPNASASQSRDEELRLAFEQAYVDVRNVLESNILHRFLRTEEFREAAHRPPTTTARYKLCCCV